MKTKILTTVILAVFVSALTFAQAPAIEKSKKNVDVQLTSKNLILVRYQNAENEKIKIKVYDAENNFVTAKTVTGSGNLKVLFDMSKLPEGDYTYKVYSNKNQICAEVVSKLSAYEYSIPKRLMEFYSVNDSIFFTEK